MSNTKFMVAAKRERIIDTAMELFLRHGYGRVNMKDLAQRAKISRPGLYLYFKTKEDVFSAAVNKFGQASLKRTLSSVQKRKNLRDKLFCAFDVWVVETFELTLKSEEAKELSDNTYLFAREALNDCYIKFEHLIADLIRSNRTEIKGTKSLSPEKMAHLIVSAVRGFKLVANDGPGLRSLIRSLLTITLGLD